MYNASINELNELHKIYKAGNLAKRDFEEAICQYILKHHKQFYIHNWDKEKCIDHLSNIYPHLGAIIDAYKDKGSSFEKYIMSRMYWFVMEYYSREAYLRKTEKAFWEAETSDAALCDRDAFYDASFFEETAELKSVSNPKMVLVLLLKSYFYVSDDLALRIAPAIGMEENKLISMLNALRKIRFEHDEKLKKMQERIYRQHYRYIIAERRLKSICKHDYSYKLEEERCAKKRKRHANMKNRFDCVNRNASNSEISQVTGFPKGTVDSCVFAMRRKNIFRETTVKVISKNDG